MSALNKAARRALEKDPSRDLPDIEEEQKMQQNIDAEMKDLTNAERKRRPPRQAARANPRGIEQRASGLTDDNDNRPQGHHHPEFP